MTRRIRILVFIDLIQDLDVLAPFIARLSADRAFSLRVIVSKWLLTASPRTAAVLETVKAPFKTVKRHAVVCGTLPTLGGVDALLTASESNHAAHTAGWALTRRANAAGVATYTVQHGLRMPGLGGATPASFASNKLLCWFSEDSQPTGLSEDTRAKLAFVGRVINPAELAAEARFDLAIFENLHDEVYSDADRQKFLETLFSALRARGDLRVCIRTHPAGAWLDPYTEEIKRTGAVFISSAEARASKGGAAVLIAEARSVLTTPSTVALDAAQAGRPVGLALTGGENFKPLAVLSDAEAWLAFAGTSRFGPAEEAFLAKHLASGDAWARVRVLLIADFEPLKNTSVRLNGHAAFSQ